MVDYHIAVMEIVDVATAHRCTGLNNLSLSSDGEVLLASLLRTQVRSRFHLVYTRRQKTARVLYPTAQDEPSQGFSQGHFHHTSSQKPSPS